MQQESLILESGLGSTIESLVYFLESNLESDFEFNKNHKDDILKYLSDIDKQQKRGKITLPVKIMLLGNHAAGKTTFLQYLLYGTLLEKNTESTHVLNIHSYPVNQKNKELPQAMIYDFGGQDYYHGIYRAFFSEDSITLLLWCLESNKNDLRKAQDKTDCDTCDFTWEYWLFQLDEAMNRRTKHIKDKTKEPLLLVQTHADINHKRYNYPNNILNSLINFEIKGEYFITLLKETAEKTNNHKFIGRLKEDLLDIVQEKTTPQEKPAHYKEFLHYVLNFEGEEYVRVKEDILDKGYYKREPINNETEDDLLRYLEADLNQLYLKGVILYYRGSSIDDIVWLNSSKTIEYIFKSILSKDIITDKKGIIPEDDFNELWKKSKIKEEIFETIKKLLINEKIVFLDKSKKEYIIPNFLPLSSDDKLHGTLSGDFAEQDLSFILKFRNFIPFGLINELICLYGNLPDDKYYWRDQFIFRFDLKHSVWIKFNFPQLSIEIYIRENKKVSELKLNEVRRAIFLNIIDLYQGDDSAQWINDEEISDFSERVRKYIQEKEKIEYPKDMYISVGKGIYVNPLDFGDNKPMIPAYELTDSGETTRKGEKIEILEKKATTTSEINLYKDFNNKNVTRMKKIFISYSRKDVDYKDELKKYLNMLKTFDIADNWSCEEISIEKWHDKIQKELQESDLIIYMLSANFFNSNYILENEIKEGLKQVSENKNKKVLCVIVSDFIGMDDLGEFLKGKLITDTQKAIMQLSQWQYLPYGMIENKVTGNSEEKIIPLKRYPDIEVAYTQIAKKVLEVLK